MRSGAALMPEREQEQPPQGRFAWLPRGAYLATRRNGFGGGPRGHDVRYRFKQADGGGPWERHQTSNRRSSRRGFGILVGVALTFGMLFPSAVASAPEALASGRHPHATRPGANRIRRLHVQRCQHLAPQRDHGDASSIQSPFNAESMLLLTDGTVMVQENQTANWWRLTPDSSGSYVNGTWSQLASMPAGYAPKYYASAVLPDGRVLVEGGEYLGASDAIVESNLGAIYAPVADKWTSVDPPSGWTEIGDAPGVVLANGQFMMGNIETTGQALFNATKLTWQAGQARNKNSEEGWSLLPNGKVLTVDVNNGRESEVFTPSTGAWTSAGTLP